MLAREVMELKSRESALLATQSKHSRQRSKSAVLREKIRRDYDALLSNLDMLEREERKIKATQVSSSRVCIKFKPCRKITF